jgi:hypothetical protein
MTNWQDGVNFDIPIMGVRRAKISWLYFTTSDTDQLLLTLKCFEFEGSGYLPNTNNKYFLSVPLDKSSDVTCVYTNFYQEFDHHFLILPLFLKVVVLILRSWLFVVLMHNQKLHP